MLVSAVIFCMLFTDIVVVTSMFEVLLEANPKSFKYTHAQTKPGKITKNPLYFFLAEMLSFFMCRLET